MRSLIDLECRLLKDDTAGVKHFLDEVDRRTANEAMAAATEALGFPVAIVDGWMVTTGAHVARIMGLKSDSAVRNLRQKYSLTPVYPRWSSSQMTTTRRTLGINPKDSRVVLCAWDTILVCGMVGRTEGADRVKAYLLESERTLRALTDKDMQKARATQWREAEILARMVERIRKSPDDELRTLLIRKTEEALGHRISEEPPAPLSLVGAPPDGRH